MAAPKGNCFNPKGRPPKEINWEHFENLCQLQCTLEDIAGFFKICKDTLIDRVQKHYEEDFSTVYKKHSSEGRCSLRRIQFRLAQKNANMCIFLGKQKAWLSQTDNAQEPTINEEILKQYADVMSQLKQLQAEKISASSGAKGFEIA